MSDTTATAKRITRKKVSSAPSMANSLDSAVTEHKTIPVLEEPFDTLIKAISEAKSEFSVLQKSIAETKETWEKEQKLRELQIYQQNQELETVRKREQEAYEYETKKSRRLVEDEFLERKAKWEKDFLNKKEEIEKEKKELEELRKRVTGFDGEIAKAVKEATTLLQKDLQEEFSMEKKLREQEYKAEKDMFGLRIANLTQENTRQVKEIEELKKAFEEATKQLKDVAVRVIDSSNASLKPQPIIQS